MSKTQHKNMKVPTGTCKYHFCDGFCDYVTHDRFAATKAKGLGTRQKHIYKN